MCNLNTKRGLHSKVDEGCAFKMSGGVCIQNMNRGVHQKLSRGVCIGGSAFANALAFTNALTFTNAHPPRDIRGTLV